MSAAGREGVQLRLAGGMVRDLLLATAAPREQSPSMTSDLDLVVGGDARLLGGRLQDEWGGRLVKHGPFLTAKWYPGEKFLGRLQSVGAAAAPGFSMDLITARSEAYLHPGQLPDVQPGSFDDDISRRDLSVNTFALDMDQWPGFGDEAAEVVLHHWPGAMEDLQNKTVRLLHAGSLRDDPTRMLRMARYGTRLGFKVDPESEAWLEAAVRGDFLKTVSRERIRAELALVLSERKAGDAFRELHAWGLTTPLGLEPDWDALDVVLDESRRMPGDRLKRNWLLLLGLQPQHGLEAVRESLALPESCLASAMKLHSSMQRDWNSISGSQIWNRLHRTDPVEREALALLRPELSEPLRMYEEELVLARPRLNGTDLIEKGYPAGPALGTALAELHRRRLDGWKMSLAQEWACVMEVLGEPPFSDGI